MTARSHNAHRRTAGGWLAAALLVFAVVGMRPAAAQAQAAPYDHPLFTGPVREAPEPGFDQEHLRLALRFDAPRRRVFGEATLRLRPLDTSLDTLRLHAAGLAIDSVLVGAVDSAKVAAAFRTDQAEALLVALHTLRDPATPFEVRVVYNARPRRGLYFVQPEGAGPPRQFWTQGRPQAHRHWFPVLDVPGDKLTSEVLVTVDSSLRVLSGGRLVEARPAGGGLVTTHYLQDQPHAPYLVLATAGRYEVVRARVQPAPGARTVPLSYWVYPERIGDVARTFGRTPDALRFFSDLLGVPFPWDGYAQVVLSRFSFGETEGAGAAALSDRILLDERAALDEDPDGVVARVLARQWFGGLVTARSWNDAWLHEGFAAYLGALFEEEARGADAFALAMLALSDAYLAEARAYRRPLVWNRWEDPVWMFDAHSAARGAWVLHLLRRRLGDETFREVLRSYLSAFAFQSVETGDFRRVLEAVTQQDFGDFFAHWVTGAGHPALEVSYAFDGDQRALSFTVVQTQDGPGVPAVFPLDVAVDVHTLTETFRFRLPLDDRVQTLTFPFASYPRFVVVDPEEEVLAEVRVDQPARAWVGQLRGATNAVSRLRAARALAAFKDDPALAIGLRSALEQEPSAAVRAAVVETMRLLPPSPALLRALIETFEDDDPAVRAAVLDALGAYAGAPEVEALAFRAAQQDRSYRVQAAAVRALAHTGSPDAPGVARSALVTPSHREVIRQAAFEALALLEVPAREGVDLALPYTAAGQPSEVRAAAAGYLATLAAEARTALDRLVELVGDDDLRVRGAAIAALGAVGTPRARTALEARLAEEPQPLLQAAIEQALRRSGEAFR